MKCEICKEEIKSMYLDKQLGTVVKDAKGKKHWVCNECQNKHPKKQDQLAKIS